MPRNPSYLASKSQAGCYKGLGAGDRDDRIDLWQVAGVGCLVFTGSVDWMGTGRAELQDEINQARAVMPMPFSFAKLDARGGKPPLPARPYQCFSARSRKETVSQ